MRRAIIFDLDGTLWDTSSEVESVWNNVAIECGISIKKEQIKEIMGFTKEEIITYLFKDNIKKEMNLLQNVKSKKMNI